MNPIRATVLLASVFLLTPTAPSSAAEWVVQPEVAYSGMRSMNGAGVQMSGPVHYDHGKERWEAETQGMNMVMIRRPDSGKAWMVMPAMNMAMEMDLSQSSMLPNPESLMQGGAPEEIGREEVAGEPTTRYRTVSQHADGAYTVDFWVTEDGIPLLMQGTGPQGDFEMTLTELQRGPQDDALFQPPQGVQIMPANPAMMGPLMRGQQ